MILLKIERLSENQIRCILSKADLAEKQLKLSELAYGSPKAKALFREMMLQASDELGFEIDNVPLMIEAVPMTPDSLVLIVTKVEDPEELDTRFSRFSKNDDIEDDDDMEEDIDFSDEDDDDDYYNDGFTASVETNIPLSGKAPEVLETLGNIISSLANLPNTMDGISFDTPEAGSTQKSDVATDDTGANNVETPAPSKSKAYTIFVFDSLNTVIKVSKQLKGFYNSTNTLYKNPSDNRFYLIAQSDENSDGEFKRACGIFAEFGSYYKSNYAFRYHMAEHFKVIVKENAVQTLATL